MTQLIETFIARQNIPPKDAAVIRDVAGNLVGFAKIPIRDLEKIPEQERYSTATAKKVIHLYTRLDFETRRHLAWLIDKTVFSIQQGVKPSAGRHSI